jgi:hypothetical protein
MIIAGRLGWCTHANRTRRVNTGGTVSMLLQIANVYTAEGCQGLGCCSHQQDSPASKRGAPAPSTHKMGLKLTLTNCLSITGITI